MEVLRFDFNGSSGETKRTAHGFLRINVRLTKIGVFKYDNGREYRSEEEVFRADSLESLKGTSVTDLHPAEKGAGRPGGNSHLSSPSKPAKALLVGERLDLSLKRRLIQLSWPAIRWSLAPGCGVFSGGVDELGEKNLTIVPISVLSRYQTNFAGHHDRGFYLAATLGPQWNHSIKNPEAKAIRFGGKFGLGWYVAAGVAFYGSAWGNFLEQASSREGLGLHFSSTDQT